MASFLATLGSKFLFHGIKEGVAVHPDDPDIYRAELGGTLVRSGIALSNPK